MRSGCAVSASVVFIVATTAWAPSARTADRPGRFAWPEGQRGAVSLSFDDARASQVDVGLALLADHDVKATFYVQPDGLLARLQGWKTAAAAGHEIGSHSLSHPCTGNYSFSLDNALEDYTLERMDGELRGANELIREKLGVTVASFAYPCGQTFVGRGQDVRSYVPLVARRFLTGRTYLDEDANDPAVLDLAKLLGMGMDELAFEQVRPMLEKTVREGRWLILAGHEIGSEGHQTTRVDTLKALCRWARDPANGIWIDTVDAVARHVLEQRRATAEVVAERSGQ